MGCASSKHLERVLKAETPETIKRKRSFNVSGARKSLHKNRRSKSYGHQNHHVSLTSSTYGVLQTDAHHEEDGHHTPEKSLSFNSTTNHVYEKIKNLDLNPDSGPQPWSEVRKALEDLRPELEHETKKNWDSGKIEFNGEELKFHTVEELDAQIAKAAEDNVEEKVIMVVGDRRNDNHGDTKSGLVDHNSFVSIANETIVDSEIITSVQKSLKREEWEVLSNGQINGVENKESIQIEKKRSPLDDYEEKCPPGGENSVVLYVTSLRGIRKTFEDCNNVRSILEGFHVPIDERDIAMDANFRNELKELMGKPTPVPTLFIRGRYIGGVEDVMQLNDDGKMDDLLEGFSTDNRPRKACEGCGGMRFVPCLECSGSCKLVDDEGNQSRCPHCNENGLIQCPLCC